MELNAYAKVNMILNVLGTLPNGYHEVEMLMHAISLCDVVTVEYDEPASDSPEINGSRLDEPGTDKPAADSPSPVLGPQNFAYGTSDLAYRAALMMAETFRPDLLCSAVDTDGMELAAGIRGVKISIEKHIPAAAGLAGGSSDAAAVMVGLAKLWNLEGRSADKAFYSSDQRSLSQSAYRSSYNSDRGPLGQPAHCFDQLLSVLLSLGAKLGSDVPFCIAAQLGHPAAIARGTGTELEFVEPVDCAVSLFFSDRTLQNKTAAVYRELRAEDCRPRYDISAFLAAKTIEEKRALMGNHLQAAAERLLNIRRAECLQGHRNANILFNCAMSDPGPGPASAACPPGAAG